MDHATQPFEGSNSFSDTHNKKGGKSVPSAGIKMVECDRQRCNQSAHLFYARPRSALRSPLLGWKGTEKRHMLGNCGPVK